MPNDSQYLARLQDYYARHRVLPSYSGIGELVGLASKASVADMVLRLKSERFLESAPDKRLKPGRRFFERLIVDGGAVHARTASPPRRLGLDPGARRAGTPAVPDASS